MCDAAEICFSGTCRGIAQLEDPLTNCHMVSWKNITFFFGQQKMELFLKTTEAGNKALLAINSQLLLANAEALNNTSTEVNHYKK